MTSRIVYTVSQKTDAMCGASVIMHFVADFTKNATVNELSKSANICQSYERMYSCTVFWLTVYIAATAIILYNLVTDVFVCLCELIWFYHA